MYIYIYIYIYISHETPTSTHKYAFSQVNRIVILDKTDDATKKYEALDQVCARCIIAMFICARVCECMKR